VIFGVTSNTSKENGFWQLADKVIVAQCAHSEEAAVYLGYQGTLHVISGFGYFVLNECIERPKTIEDLVHQAEYSFEPDSGIDLHSSIDNILQRLSELGILEPCSHPI
jgi:hypothetical protein